MRILVCIVGIVFGLAPPLQAGDWPQFRGPTGDGHYEGLKLPTRWGPATNVVWKTAIPGQGWSSPIIWKGKIYLTTAVAKKDDYSLQALRLDAQSGKIDWQKEVFIEVGATAPKPHPKNSHASATPITDGERLYVHFGHMGTAALDLNGKILWKNDKLTYRPVHGNGGSPILVDDKLVFSCDGADAQFVVALNKKTGTVAWKVDRNASPRKGFSFGTPQLITVDGKKQIVSPGSGVVMALDTAGKEIWRVKHGGYSLIPRPVYGNGLVYIATGYDAAVLLAIKPDGQGEVTPSNVSWTGKKAVPHTPSLLLFDESLFMVSDKGVASCLNAKTGDVIWSERVPGEYSASPIYSDGKIWITNEEGIGSVLDAGKEFNIVAKNEMKEKTFASFAAADGALYIRTDANLYRFEEKK